MNFERVAKSSLNTAGEGKYPCYACQEQLKPTSCLVCQGTGFISETHPLAKFIISIVRQELARDKFLRPPQQKISHPSICEGEDFSEHPHHELSRSLNIPENSQILEKQKLAQSHSLNSLPHLQKKAPQKGQSRQKKSPPDNKNEQAKNSKSIPSQKRKTHGKEQQERSLQSEQQSCSLKESSQSEHIWHSSSANQSHKSVSNSQSLISYEPISVPTQFSANTFMRRRPQNQSFAPSSQIKRTSNKQNSLDIFDCYVCNYCDKTLTKLRFHCPLCTDYDLCQQCYANRQDIHPLHEKFDIVTPQQQKYQKMRQKEERKQVLKAVMSKYLKPLQKRVHQKQQISVLQKIYNNLSKKKK